MLLYYSLLYILQDFVSTSYSLIEIHTDCKGLLNRITERNINRPSLVTSNHIDIVYQIREILSKIKFNTQFIFTRAAPRENPDKPPEVTPTQEELIMRDMHEMAIKYYHDETSSKPSQHAIHFPAQKIAIIYVGNTITSDLADFLQDSERRLMREEYFEHRMGIVPSALKELDHYALSRTLQRNQQYKQTYTKIIHQELNTMEVNRKMEFRH